MAGTELLIERFRRVIASVGGERILYVPNQAVEGGFLTAWVRRQFR